MISVNGMISSRKVKIPPTLPTVPLYIQVIKNPAIGAQITSENSPKYGIENDNIPIASKTIPKIRFRFLLLSFSMITSSVILVYFNTKIRIEVGS